MLHPLNDNEFDIVPSSTFQMSTAINDFSDVPLLFKGNLKPEAHKMIMLAYCAFHEASARKNNLTLALQSRGGVHK